MNPLRLVTRPVEDLVDAFSMPFKAIFVVGICWIINAATYSGQWWVKWVALGMGIATIVALARGLRALVLLGLVAWGGWWLHRRYGAAARQRFDDWVHATKPKARAVLATLHGEHTAASR